jgi:hypothetical protein
MASDCRGLGVVDPSVCGHHSKRKPVACCRARNPLHLSWQSLRVHFTSLHPPWKPRRLGDQGYDLALVPSLYNSRLSSLSRQPPSFVSQCSLTIQGLAAHTLENDPAALNRPGTCRRLFSHPKQDAPPHRLSARSFV